MQDQYREEYKKYLLVLFSEAWNSSPLDFIYSILRVTGLHHGHWDPYVELIVRLQIIIRYLNSLMNKKA